MLLRDHPLMSYRGVRNWPSTWLWVGGEVNERPRGEVGIVTHIYALSNRNKELVFDDTP
jgi:hypothetical protein